MRGEPQRVAIAFAGVAQIFPGQGKYLLRLSLNGALAKQMPFTLVQAPGGAMPGR